MKNDRVSKEQQARNDDAKSEKKAMKWWEGFKILLRFVDIATRIMDYFEG